MHFHTGHVAQIKLYRGEMMQPQPPADVEAELKLYKPDGTEERLISGEIKDDYYLINFEPETEGFYTLTARDVNGCYAKIIVPVGHHLQGPVNPVGEDLEVTPDFVQEYHLKDMIKISVSAAGNPLADASIKATYHFYDGNDYPYTFFADASGRAQFIFPEKGHWMFAVTSEGRRATYVVMGVR
jgi:hypothetical protein